ncbi:hypothetical protein DdX_04517 [Ditylenchus destructor]|uniref:Uncharacterized protein n=1 Tax=Ditylenchus destructor TaxID=166010 RepID=A0AAD4R7U3_9BILA|nr:hypothetical protein DdX_04517 [Ditylenchus destructor]
MSVADILIYSVAFILFLPSSVFLSSPRQCFTQCLIDNVETFFAREIPLIPCTFHGQALCLKECYPSNQTDRLERIGQRMCKSWKLDRNKWTHCIGRREHDLRTNCPGFDFRQILPKFNSIKKLDSKCRWIASLRSCAIAYLRKKCNNSYITTDYVNYIFSILLNFVELGFEEAKLHGSSAHKLPQQCQLLADSSTPKGSEISHWLIIVFLTFLLVKSHYL